MQQRGISQIQIALLSTFGNKERQKGKSYIVRIRQDVLEQIYSYFGLSGKAGRHKKMNNRIANEIAEALQYKTENLTKNDITALRKDVEGLKDIAVILSDDDAVLTTIHQYKKIRTER
jgi:hypothetical protein